MRTEVFDVRPLASLLVLVPLLVPSEAGAHGLMEEPASRNWFCGAVTKPDQVANGTAAYPVCRGAFASDPNGGYSFMSVLTHARGRAVVNPLPRHVCGFGSETWQGGATPWDQPIDWPTNAMQSGRNKITWNISWGPHFDDTEEFRYWITKPDFVFRVGTPLSWSDFEAAPFCSLQYRDNNPSASPDVVARKAEQRFDTYCTVPARQGRHVIYGEWGRNQYTFERFHGCIDAVFSGGGSVPVAPVARIGRTPDSAEVRGSATLALDAGASSGTNLSYRWTVSPSNALYTLENPTSPRATLRLGAPSAATTVTIGLAVTGAAGTDATTATFTHVPVAGVVWQDIGALAATPRELAAGDAVRLRVVNRAGADLHLPRTPITLNAGTAAGSIWPATLAQAVNAASSDLRVGVLRNGEVTPVQDATSNRVYALGDSGLVSAFVEVVSAPVPPPGQCSVTVRPGRGPYWAGFDLATANAEVTLDFTGTSLDLGQVRLDPGVFQATVTGQRIVMRKPAWVNASTPGYFGMNANNYAPLATFTAPTCR
ncbi:hypothetical protein GCM10028794_15750 [Silanimonas algicola]